MATPTLALIPTGYKAGKLYSVLPESGVGDFTVVRATEATRVNEEGLIETMGANVPRLDYSGGGCPVLLTEGQSTNILTNSENGSTYTVFSATKTLDEVISPNGTLNSFTLEGNGNYNQILGETVSVTLPSAGVYTFSVFAKKGTNDFIQLFFNQFSGSSNGEAYFDLENGTTPSSFGKIENYGNGWYRCSVVGTVVGSDLSGKFGFRISYTSSNFFFPTANDANGKNAYFYGFQTEQGSYSTSLINTQGSAVTRVADSCSQTVPDGIIGQTEGTMYWEGKFQDGQNPILMQIVPSSANYLSSIYIDFNKTINLIRFHIYDSGVIQATLSTSATPETKYKIALAYKQNDIQGYVNGVSIGSDTNATIQSGLNNLIIGGLVGYVNNNTFIGTKPNNVRLYNTRLSNAELAALTTI